MEPDLSGNIFAVSYKFITLSNMNRLQPCQSICKVVLRHSGDLSYHANNDSANWQMPCRYYAEFHMLTVAN